MIEKSNELMTIRKYYACSNQEMVVKARSRAKNNFIHREIFSYRHHLQEHTSIMGSFSILSSQAVYKNSVFRDL